MAMLPENRLDPKEPCLLCGNAEGRVRSHIVPRFVVKGHEGNIGNGVSQDERRSERASTRWAVGLFAVPTMRGTV